MNEQERQEIESIRLELHEMFEDSAMHTEIMFHITSKLWKLSHRKNVDHAESQRDLTCRAW